MTKLKLNEFKAADAESKESPTLFTFYTWQELLSSPLIKPKRGAPLYYEILRNWHEGMHAVVATHDTTKDGVFTEVLGYVTKYIPRLKKGVPPYSWIGKGY